jgi:hypothetical protein
MARSAELRVQHQQRWFHRSHATSLDYLETRELEQIKRSLLQSFFYIRVIGWAWLWCNDSTVVDQYLSKEHVNGILDISQILFALVHLHRCRRARSR